MVETETRTVKCPKCNNEWAIEFTKERKVLKSNVDVYLGTDMVVRASKANHPICLVLVSCDGDYAEAIKTMIDLNDNVSVIVLATPYVKDIRKNTLSTKLRKLASELPAARFTINNIKDVQDLIS